MLSTMAALINQHHSILKELREVQVVFFFTLKIENGVMLSNMTADDRVCIELHDTSTDNNDIYICFCYLPPRDSSVTCNNQSAF